MAANQTNWNTISMIAELTWKDDSFTVLLRPEWRDRVAKRTETSEAQLQHPMRIDRLMILLQSFSEFAGSRDYSLMMVNGRWWADNLHLNRRELWWEVFPVFFEGNVQVRLGGGEKGPEICEWGHVSEGRLGVWVVREGSGLTTVGDQQVSFSIPNLRAYPNLIKFEVAGTFRILG